ncbi:hypothetical protein EDB81DRAFT_922848 [Dactylonectria macrodidyma]|uniref:Uncharacterized protein n=1 Tax=Dactylonectria macrodidyma TaxID=307937 RepID=A0A9P9I9G3_9HYPO|nr:hypothetical protein EDB81DRAFT_922848 [Dactylonectria macrodidyma]
MITLLSPNFVLQEVTEDDLALASLAWGFTIGFGWLTTWTALKQTKHIYERRGLLVFRNAYVWMIWLEILVCLIFSIICCFAFFFCIRKHLITAVNISVYNIWIPARLQISERYIWINEWWDRVEKVIYLLVDGALNFYFIRIVQQNLVANGLTKYKGLVKFNMCIVGFSLSMDVLIISMMSLHNTFVYMQFHPFAYIVKLKIEIQRDCGVISDGTFGDLETARQSTAPSKGLTSTYIRTRVSTDGIRTVHGVDAASIELQEGPDGSAAFNGWSKANRDTGFLGQSSSSSLQVGVAIYTTENNRIDVDAATSNHGESTCSVTDSLDENGSARKDSDDERPLRYKQMEDRK